MPGTAHIDFAGMIDTIYESAAFPERWPDVLTKLSTRFGSQGAVLYSNTSQGIFGYESNTDWIHHRRDYGDAGWHKDTTRYDWLALSPYSGFRTDLDFVNYEDLKRIPIYRDFLIPRKIDAGAATLLPGLSGDELLFSLEAFPSHEHAREALPLLDEFRPHLARAAMLSARLRLANVRAAIAALEIAKIGGAIVANKGMILESNPIFDKVTLNNIKFIERFVHRLKEKSLFSGFSFSASVPLKLERDFAILHAVPICGDSRDIFTDSSHFLIISQRRKIESEDADLLREMYDLTNHETNVAILISSGMRVEEIALERGVSVQTVRSQLKTIFSKLDIHNQTDLALCISNILAR